MNYWDGTKWVTLDAKNSDTLDNKHASDFTGATDYTKLVPYAGVTTGTANTYAISTPTITALTAGMAVSVKFNIDSTGASTLNWNGKGAKGIKKANGTDATNLKASGIYTLRYDGTNFILQGEGGEYGTAGAGQTLTGYSIGTDTGLVNGTMANNSGATLTAGQNVTANVVEVTPSGTVWGDGWGGTIGINIKDTGYVDATTILKQNVYGLHPSVVKAGQTIGENSTDGTAVEGVNYVKGTFTSDANVTAGVLLTGYSGYANGLKVDGTMVDNYNTDNIVAAPEVSGTTLKFNIPTTARYRAGYHLQATDADFAAGNIVSGKNIFGLTGTFSGVLPNTAVSKSYVVDTGSTITAGDLVNFINGKANKGTQSLYIRGADAIIPNADSYTYDDKWAIKLDSTHIFMCYETDNILRAVVGTISGNTISFGAVVTVASDSTDHYHCSCLELIATGKVLIGYTHDVGTSCCASFTPDCRIASVSGTTVTLGTPTTISSFPGSFQGCRSISSTTFMVFDAARAKIITFSGTSITAQGALYTYNSVGGQFRSAETITATTILVTWFYSTSVRSAVLTISGTTITAKGTEFVLGSADTGYPFSCTFKLDSGKIVAVFTNTSNLIVASVVTVSGTTITQTTPVVLSSRVYRGSNYGIAAKLRGEKFCVVFQDTNSNNAINLFSCVVSSSNTFLVEDTSTSWAVNGIYASLNLNSVAGMGDGNLFVPHGSDMNTNCCVVFVGSGAMGVANTGGTAGQTITCLDWSNV